GPGSRSRPSPAGRPGPATLATWRWASWRWPTRPHEKNWSSDGRLAGNLSHKPREPGQGLAQSRPKGAGERRRRAPVRRETWGLIRQDPRGRHGLTITLALNSAT